MSEYNRIVVNHALQHITPRASVLRAVEPEEGTLKRLESQPGSKIQDASKMAEASWILDPGGCGAGGGGGGGGSPGRSVKVLCRGPPVLGQIGPPCCKCLRGFLRHLGSWIRALKRDPL